MVKDVAEWIDYYISSANKMIDNVDDDEETTRNNLPSGTNYQTEARFLTAGRLFIIEK